MSVWFDPDPAYDCIFLLWSEGDRWFGYTEFPDVTMKVTMRRGWTPSKSDWIYIGEFD